MKFILSAFVIVFFLSCAANKQNEKFPPSWYLNAKQNDNNYIYGVGEGKTFLQAKSRALKVMSASLNVYVNFIINKQIIKVNNQLQSTYSKNIKANKEVKTKQIAFPNVKVVKKSHIKDVYFVMLKTNKRLLSKYKKDDFLYTHSKILNMYNSSNKQTKLKQIKTLLSLKKQITKAKHQAAIVYAIDNSFDYKKYFFIYQNIQNKLEKLQQNISIKIKIKNQYKTIKDELNIFLNSHQYNIVSADKYDMLIDIKIFDKSYKKGRWYISKLNMIITFRDKYNSLVISKKIRIDAKSVSGKNSSLIYASKKLGKKLQKLGAKKFLFYL